MSELVMRLRLWWLNRGRSALEWAARIAIMAIGALGLFMTASQRSRPPEFVEGSVPVWECDDVVQDGLMEAPDLRKCIGSRPVYLSRLSPPDATLRIPDSERVRVRVPIRRGMLLSGEPFEPVPNEALEGVVPLPVQADLAPIARSERITRTLSPPRELVMDLLARSAITASISIPEGAEGSPVGEISVRGTGEGYYTVDVVFRCPLFSPDGSVCYARPLGGALYAPGDVVLALLTPRDAAVLLAGWRADSPRPAQVSPQQKEGGGLLP